MCPGVCGSLLSATRSVLSSCITPYLKPPRLLAAEAGALRPPWLYLTEPLVHPAVPAPAWSPSAVASQEDCSALAGMAALTPRQPLPQQQCFGEGCFRRQHDCMGTSILLREGKPCSALRCKPSRPGRSTVTFLGEGVLLPHQISASLASLSSVSHDTVVCRSALLVREGCGNTWGVECHRG